jgi:hypothetical protein
MSRRRPRGFLRDNGLSLFFGAIFLAALVGQAFSGWADHNNQQVAEGLQTVSLAQFVTSSEFGVDVVENWQSEYLQFLLYIVATVWLVQRGSPESKELGNEGLESDKDQKLGKYTQPDSPRWAREGGLRTAVFSQSLTFTMAAIFVLSWLGQSIAGVVAYNEQRLAQLEDPLTWAQYLTSADFWNRTLQNWQSEFLAVGSMAIFAVFLRSRGSPESKPVGEPHESTGVTG